MAPDAMVNTEASPEPSSVTFCPVASSDTFFPLLTANGFHTPLDGDGTKIVPLQLNVQLPPCCRAAWTAAVVHEVIPELPPAGPAPKSRYELANATALMAITPRRA